MNLFLICHKLLQSKAYGMALFPAPYTKPTTNSFLTAVESRYLGSSLGWQLDFRELQQIMQKSGNFLHPPPRRHR